ncbi:MAG: GNAT family N-acetyltransferase [Anaerolineae bacterium]
MSTEEHVRYRCARETFLPDEGYAARWLDWEEDYALARDLWPEPGLAKETWLEARDLGYRYCAVVEAGEIRAIAAVWRNTEEAWELSAVYTRPGYRRRGYGRAACAYATAAILEAGRTATCTTREGNAAMRATADALGYRLVAG